MGIHTYITWSPLSAWNLNLPFRIEDEIRIVDNFWTVIGSFLQQGNIRI